MHTRHCSSLQSIFLPIFPKTLQNKFYSNLVAQCLAFVVNFFVRTIHYLYFCYTRDFKVVELHICFYRKKLKTEILSLCTAGLFDRNFFSLSQTSSPAYCASTLSPLVVSNVAGQGAEIRLTLSSFSFQLNNQYCSTFLCSMPLNFHENPDSSC